MLVVAGLSVRATGKSGEEIVVVVVSLSFWEGRVACPCYIGAAARVTGCVTTRAGNIAIIMADAAMTRSRAGTPRGAESAQGAGWSAHGQRHDAPRVGTRFAAITHDWRRDRRRAYLADDPRCSVSTESPMTKIRYYIGMSAL